MLIETLKNLAESSYSVAQKGAVAGFLRPIDTERIAQAIELSWKAAENGRKNLPPATSDAFDAVEQEIIQKIESEWTWQGGELVNNLRAYATRLIGCSVEAEFETLRLQAQSALTRLRAAHHRAADELEHLKLAYLDARREFDSFRQRHRLQRPARNLTHRWTTFGLLLVIVAFEAVFNGFFFAKVSDFGLIGGVGTAIGISLVNVAVAFLLGLGPARWIRHRKFVVKLPGTFLTVAGTALLLGGHAFAAHLRDAMGSVAEERAMSVAIDRLLHAPLTIEDISSGYLFVLGAVFALAAIWKGYTYDDPYPGYGAVTRRLDRARENYSAEHSDLFDDLERIKDDVIEAIETGISRIPLLPQHAATIRAQRDAIVQNFRAYEVAVASAANQLLAQYRGINREHRTAPPPFRFDRVWNLPHSFLASGEIRKLLADPEEPPPEITPILNNLRELSQSVLNEYETLMTRYPHAAQMQ